MPTPSDRQGLPHTEKPSLRTGRTLGVGPVVQAPSPRLACFAAARFAVRRSLSVFCAGFFPSFLGFCEPFIASFPLAEFDAVVGMARPAGREIAMTGGDPPRASTHRVSHGIPRASVSA